MENIFSIYQGGEEEEAVPDEGVRTFNPKSKTYLSPANINRTRATEDIPQVVPEIEIVRGNVDEKSESEIFRRSSLLLHSPPKAKDEKKRIVPPVLNNIRIGSLPDVGELKPIIRLERVDPARPRRASTPLETTRVTEGDESVAIVGDLTLTQGEAERMEKDRISEVSSVVFVPSMTHKRVRGVLSDSAASASATGDEGSVAVSEEGPKKKKRGRPRAANILDQIVTG